MNRRERRKAAKQNRKKANLSVGYVDQIMHNLDLNDEPQLAYTMMVNKLMDSPKRKKTLADTGEIIVNYTIQPNGNVVETPMQSAVDNSQEQHIIVMDEKEQLHFARRHGFLVVKDSARASKEWISKLAPELQNALSEHGDLYIGKMYHADKTSEHEQYIGGAFRKEVA